MSDRLLMAFYGDDFTGSTDAMEAMEINGIKTVLFIKPPEQGLLEKFKDVQCIGIAGTSRAKNKDGMKEELDAAFSSFSKVNPYFVHYKVCSTFDSSEEVGSIGYATDLGVKYFKKKPVPLLVAAPELGRFTVFSQHFAKIKDAVYRLDRHPIMSIHPVTPMNEADLRLHLEKQTNQSIDSINVLDLDNGTAEVEKKFNQLKDDEKDIVVFDGLKQEHLTTTAEVLWNGRNESSQFVVGSSGVEYALGGYWKSIGLAKESQPKKPNETIDQFLVVSGSVSEITSTQLSEAIEQGFHAEKIPYKYFGTNEIPTEFVEKITSLLKTKEKVIIYTAAGPKDNAIKDLRNHLEEKGVEKHRAGEVIGSDLGEWTKKIVEGSSLKRIVISGGDTAGFVASELDIYALEILTSISPGAPLCYSHSLNQRFDGLEIALKGGQLGGENYYEKVRLFGQRG